MEGGERWEMVQRGETRRGQLECIDNELTATHRGGRRHGTFEQRGCARAWEATGRNGGSEVESQGQLGTVEKGVSRLQGLTFSLQMVWMTSSGGVPRSSVMMENWLTSICIKKGQLSLALQGRVSRDAAANSRSFPGNSGRPSSISAKMQPALQMSTATSYFCQVSMISGAR